MTQRQGAHFPKNGQTQPSEEHHEEQRRLKARPQHVHVNSLGVLPKDHREHDGQDQ